MASANLWRIYSAAVPTTAAMVRQATGTSIKTHLQLTAPSNDDLIIRAWGVMFETTPTAFIHAELIQTATVAGGSPTAVVPTNLQGSTASAATAGFAPSSEGTVAGTPKVFDDALLLTNYYRWEWSLGSEPILEASQVLRVRMTTSVTINALCYIDFE